MADEWYRKSSWTDDDQQDFTARLGRARRHNRAQYLRIQATELAKNDLVTDAISLLDKLINDYPDDTFLCLAFDDRANCLASIKDFEAAVCDYRQSLETQKLHPNVRPNTWLDFPWMVFDNNLAAIFEEAADVLSRGWGENKMSLQFPVSTYMYHAMMAVYLSHSRGSDRDARQHARKALTASDQDNSGLRYHPTVGLVNASLRDSAIHHQILSLLR